MENGVEALKLGASMLIFVLAITITIFAFTSASQALNRIFAMHDADEYFIEEGNKEREVGVETIIPSIYRAYKENYAIYFYKSDGSDFVLYETEKGGNTIRVNYIDLEKEVHSSAEKAIEHINKLLYEEGLYNRLQEKNFTEKLGEYYMDDINGETGTAEVNKIKKRVIAYIQK